MREKWCYILPTMRNQKQGGVGTTTNIINAKVYICPSYMLKRSNVSDFDTCDGWRAGNIGNFLARGKININKNILSTRENPGRVASFFINPFRSKAVQ